MLNWRLVQGGLRLLSSNKSQFRRSPYGKQLEGRIFIISCKISDRLETHIYVFFETNTGAATLAKYRTFKSIRRNLFTEAIRPQRDLKPFITPLMTSQCQHAEFTRWQGHLHLHVLSITFQCVTHIFAPFFTRTFFPLLVKWIRSFNFFF